MRTPNPPAFLLHRVGFLSRTLHHQQDLLRAHNCYRPVQIPSCRQSICKRGGCLPPNPGASHMDLLHPACKQRTQGSEDQGTNHGTRGPRDQRTKRPGTPMLAAPSKKKTLDPQPKLHPKQTSQERHFRMALAPKSLLIQVATKAIQLTPHKRSIYNSLHGRRQPKCMSSRN